MGAFLTNLHVRTKDGPVVVRALRKTKALPACVSPAKNGWISAFPKCTESQEQQVLERVAHGVADQTGQAVIAFLVHDSDILRYEFAHGDKRDSYDSDPGYWDDPDLPPKGGDPAILLPYCIRGTKEAELKALLRKKQVKGEDGMAEDLMVRLGEWLGIDGDLLSNSWEYLKAPKLKLPWGLKRINR